MKTDLRQLCATLGLSFEEALRAVYQRSSVECYKAGLDTMADALRSDAEGVPLKQILDAPLPKNLPTIEDALIAAARPRSTANA